MAALAVRELLREAADRLRSAGVESPEADARLLLAHATGWRLGELGLREHVPAEPAARYAQLVNRRERREPLQHLTGRAWFRHVELAVGPGVFVPRPETEVMVGWAVAELRRLVAGGQAPVVVDLGTGSGAIARALTQEVPQARVHAVEVSPEAAAWAARNLAGSGVALHLVDMADALPELNGGVDLLVANPPYVPLDAYLSVSPEARDYDPELALFAGTDGLDAIRTVARVGARLLAPGGQLACEHADVQADAAVRVLLDTGNWTGVRDHPDLTGRDRFVTATRCSPARAAAASFPARDDLA